MDVYIHCNLRRLRKSKGYSLKQLAGIVGINHGSLSKYERNESFMNIVTAARIALVLDCTLDQLFTYRRSAGEV